jgi:tRNA-(ms[2]io[6]A)-hydroxylase
MATRILSSGKSRLLDVLPLKYRTPDRWADDVLQQPLALLSDHAYLERKAASNVLDLFNRWPEPGTPVGWSSVLSSVARDEARHLEQVMRILERRGGRLERLHKNEYAHDLRRLVRAGKGKQELLDRCLISALIELRSYERFEILARRAAERDLIDLYSGLAASEAGHYRVFIRLARRVLPREVDARWEDMLESEAQIIQKQLPGPRIHSGVKDA